MHQVIMCRFDEAAEKKILAIQQELQANGLSVAVDFPHLSLVSFEPFKDKYSAWHFRASFQGTGKLPRLIELSYLGIFAHKSRAIVFAGVTPTDRIMAVARSVHRYVDACHLATHPLFSPNKTVFHVTLGAGISKDQIPQVLAICGKLKLPMRVRIAEYGLYEYEDGYAGRRIDGMNPANWQGAPV